MDSASPSPAGARWRQIASAVLCLYAVGLFLAEGVLQAGAVLAIALALVLGIRRRLRLAPDVRAYVAASAALCVWQLVSPAVALMQGVVDRWPRGAR